MCFAGMDIEEVTKHEQAMINRFERRMMQIAAGDPRDPDWPGHWLEDEGEEE